MSTFFVSDHLKKIFICGELWSWTQIPCQSKMNDTCYGSVKVYLFVPCSQDLTAMLCLSERPSIFQTYVPLMSAKNAFESKANCFLIKRKFWREQ